MQTWVRLAVRHPATFISFLWTELRTLVLGRALVERHGVTVDLGHEAFNREMRLQFVKESFNRDIEKLRSYMVGVDADLIELGAGSGFTACYFDDVLPAERTQVAVEANESLIDVLERTRAHNDARFHIFHGAYSADGGEVEFHSHDQFWKSSAHPELEQGARETISVPATTLQDLCDLYDISTFILYCNIEGGELELLDEELDLLTERCTLAIIEFHKFGGDTEQYVNRLERNGLRLIDVVYTFYVFKRQ